MQCIISPKADSTAHTADAPRRSTEKGILTETFPIPCSSPANATGEKIVIAARVMTGKIALGHDSMPNPSGYDSTTNSTVIPIFVVYKDFQAPEYVIRVTP